MLRPVATICQRPGRTCTRSAPSASKRAGSGLDNDSGVKPSSNALGTSTSWFLPEAVRSRCVETTSGMSSLTSRLTRMSRRSTPALRSDRCLSHSRPELSRFGTSTRAPFAVSAISPTLSDSGRLSGISLHGTVPAMVCAPEVTTTPGLSPCAATGAGFPSTSTSCGQCF